MRDWRGFAGIVLVHLSVCVGVACAPSEGGPSIAPDGAHVSSGDAAVAPDAPESDADGPSDGSADGSRPPDDSGFGDATADSGSSDDPDGGSAGSPDSGHVIDSPDSGHVIDSPDSGHVIDSPDSGHVPASPAVRLAFARAPSRAPASHPFGGVEVVALDAHGNPSRDFVDPITLTLETAPAGASLGGDRSVAPSLGLARFTHLEIDLAGAFTLRAEAPGLTHAVSSSIDAFEPPVFDVRSLPLGGRLDLAPLHGGLAVLDRGPPRVHRVVAQAGALAVTASVALPPDALRLTAADLDGDGADEIVTLHQPLGGEARIVITDVNDAGATLSPRAPHLLGRSGDFRAVLSADLDSDGDLDLALADYTAGLVLIPNLGAGALGAASLVHATNAGAGAIAAADLDEDGAVDLLLANLNTVHRLLQRNGSLAFRPPYLVTGTLMQGGQTLALGDVDGDGHADFVARTTFNGAVVGRGDGAAGFSAPVGIDTWIGSRARGGGPLELIDFDGDGIRDLVHAHGGEPGAPASDLAIQLGDRGGAPFLSPIVIPLSPSPRLVTRQATIDLDQDGELDVALAFDDGELLVLFGR